ncbi:gluconate 2-dehydrogenase subunit 3 family protein [[Mycobacterium] crassicus]|uniref:Gluconate 2-dehydrogenase subunit 3 family protein n=1 Tax=[Mycobacterium] crassicus TaxID=2872309 RepID=A0ABU5XQF5_9MYCO|nr:gluconate 2-dehydrogenase subunit 3 family protein [Mycolicibacter sp. MYC098]MEB3023321.1 gluconate 2-dehydrogenase subunit 3 family protein [Mycolicibacter sp. MYC098]
MTNQKLADQRELLFQALVPAEAANLVALMENIVPHRDPELRDIVFYTALCFDAGLATATALRGEVRDLLKELDQQAVAAGATSFATAAPDVQKSLLIAIEGRPIFQQLVYATVSDFYNRHIVWQAIGYPGLAQRDGKGYINQGFDVLNWDEPTA